MRSVDDCLSIFKQRIDNFRFQFQNSSRKRQVEDKDPSPSNAIDVIDSDSDEELNLTSTHYYEVEELIDFKVVKGEDMVKVHWKGYSRSDDTWEPVANMNRELRHDVAKLREEYHQKSRRNKKKKTK